MNQKKIFCSFAMLLSIVSYNASAHDFEVDGIYYRIGEGVFVTYRGESWEHYSNRYSGKINIPASVFYDGYDYIVIGIDDYAFYGCSSLTSVTIPSSVTSIGDYAFYGCSLSSVVIPRSVTTIGSHAFTFSESSSLTIPSNVMSIGVNAFSGLTSVSVDADNSIYDSRDNCNAIIETQSNTLICGSLNTIIPPNVTIIGNEAFCGCNLLLSDKISI